MNSLGLQQFGILPRTVCVDARVSVSVSSCLCSLVVLVSPLPGGFRKPDLQKLSSRAGWHGLGIVSRVIPDRALAEDRFPKTVVNASFSNSRVERVRPVQCLQVQDNEIS